MTGACGGLRAPAEVPAAEVEVRLLARQVESGEPVVVEVDAWAAEGWKVTPPVPQADELTLVDTEESDVIREGDRWRITTRFTFSGPDGSYVIASSPGVRLGPDGAEETVEIQPLFVDVGVSGPLAKDLAGLEAPPPAREIPWLWLAGGLAALLALVGGVVFWGRRATPEPVAPELSPSEQARLAWSQARAREGDDHPLSVVLSRIFRAYLEGSSGWPASRRTGPEILAWLSDTNRLGPADQVRAARILQATDRLKFAREGGGVAFFEALDSDFSGILEADAFGSPVPQPASQPESADQSEPTAQPESAPQAEVADA